MAIAETALEALIRNGVSNSTIKSQGFITINTSRAYETEVTGTYNGKAITNVYCCTNKEWDSINAARQSK